jgi:O-antigen/teichoic acid export membrane protein
VFGLAVSIFWLAAGIPNALVWTPYTARAAKLPPARRALFAGSTLLHSVLVALAVAMGLAGAAIVLMALPSDALRGSAWLVPMCWALVPFTIMMIVREHARRISLAHLQTSDLLAIDVPIAVVQLALLLMLAYSGALSAVTALLAIAAACGGAVIWLLRERARFRFQPERAAVHWSHNQRFGRWLLCVSLMWLLGDSSYRWLVVSLHGTEVLGQFAAAQNIVLILNPVLLTVTNLTQALSANCFAAAGLASLRRMAVRSTLLLAAWAGAALFAVALVGGPLVQFIFGDEYAGLGPVVATLCLGMFARIVAMPIDGALTALKRGRVMVIAGAVRLLIIVGAGVPLIAWLGLEGVGYAMALSAVAGAAVQWSNLLQGGGDE